MILTSTNIQEWKECLSAQMYILHGIENYSDTCSSESWLEDYLHESTETAIEDEVQNWDEQQQY